MKQKETVNERNSKIKRITIGIVKLISFLIILFVCFNAINNITKRKPLYKKMADFFKQEEDFDVLFFGSSHVKDGIFPMELWNSYGIISYNMAKAGEVLPVSYYNIRLALKYHKPKLIVIDAFEVHSNENTA